MLTLTVVLLVNHASELTIHRDLPHRRVCDILRDTTFVQCRTAQRVYTVRWGRGGFDTLRSPAVLLQLLSCRCRTATRLLLEVLVVLFCFHSALSYPPPWQSAPLSSLASSGLGYLGIEVKHAFPSCLPLRFPIHKRPRSGVMSLFLQTFAPTATSKGMRKVGVTISWARLAEGERNDSIPIITYMRDLRGISLDADHGICYHSTVSPG